LFHAQPFVSLGDDSRNFAVMGPLDWGEGWHNNHHAFLHRAAFGLHWYEFDPGFLFIRLLEGPGLAWDVKVPSREKIARRRQHPASGATGDLETG
jgi:stearoyl-CoA desaturase (delta-9 desaturase)